MENEIIVFFRCKKAKSSRLRIIDFQRNKYAKLKVPLEKLNSHERAELLERKTLNLVIPVSNPSSSWMLHNVMCDDNETEAKSHCHLRLCGWLVLHKGVSRRNAYIQY